jgi:Lrp/AsnC family transcriptional regulator for asnA, asnC and gidA
MRFKQQVSSDKKVKLDIKDKKIIYWLCQNGRLPYTDLAKKVSLSTDAIIYRIKNLEKKGVIQGYVAVADIAKLGFTTHHLFLQLTQINEKIRDSVIETLKVYPFIKVIIEFSGKYDFEIGIASKTVTEADEYIQKIIDCVASYLQQYIVLTISDYYFTHTVPRNFFYIPHESEIRKHTATAADETDLKILQILSGNARAKLYDIGNKVRLSADAVNYRIKNLMKSEVIVKYAPILNYTSMGYTVYAVLMNIFPLNKEKDKTLKYFLESNENVLWAVKTIGTYNLLMYICVKSSDELHITLLKMRELFSKEIKEYETIIAYEEYVYTYFPDICVGKSNGK